MKKSLGHIIEKFFNPVSPIMTILIGWFLTLIATPYSSQLPLPVQYFLNNKNVLLAIILLWLGFDLFYDYFQSLIESKNSEIQKLQSQIEIYERNANLSANIILNKYGEFASFQRTNLFNDIFRRFVCGNVDIVSAQLYKFETLYQSRNVVFKINYVTGYTQEGTEINGIIQEYYFIDIEIAKKINEIVDLWKKILTQGKKWSYEKLKDKTKEFSDKIIFLFDKLVDDLNKISNVEDISETDFSNYLIVILLLRFMNDTEAITLNKTILNNNELDDYLSANKRNGILGSILLKDNFSILHNGKSLKNGRMYLFEYINMYQENYIAAFCIDSNKNVQDKDAIIYDLDRYSVDLQEILISGTK